MLEPMYRLIWVRSVGTETADKGWRSYASGDGQLSWLERAVSAAGAALIAGLVRREAAADKCLIPSPNMADPPRPAFPTAPRDALMLELVVSQQWARGGAGQRRTAAT